jgi:chemotaxis protein histidine kinase CheA
VNHPFLERTKSDIVRLRQMIERFRQGGQAVLEEVEQLAHSIHGAGAMCGFLQVSAAGGVIERLAERALANSPARNSAAELAVLQRLDDCTEHLASEVEAAAHSAPSGAGMFAGLA